MPKTTRQQTKDKLQSLIDRLKYIEQVAIEIGLLYQDSDSDVSSTMYVVSELCETVIPVIEQTNNNL